ncbi:MAG: cytochrome c biogenesis protein CcdA [Syntrophorhabdus sp.]
MNPAGTAGIDIGAVTALLSGVLSFFTPCILPLIPSYLIYISGITVDNALSPTWEHRRKVLLHSVCFIFGFSTIFVILGISTSFLGNFLSRYHTYILRIGGIILIILGLFFLDIIKIKFLDRQYTVGLKQKPAGFIGSFFVGIIFSIGWTPCAGPALASILIMASITGKVSHSAYLLSLYSLGLGIPFIVSALIFDRLFLLLKKYSFISRYATKILGCLFLILGILMISPYYSRVNLWIGLLLSPGI